MTETKLTPTEKANLRFRAGHNPRKVCDFSDKTTVVSRITRRGVVEYNVMADGSRRRAQVKPYVKLGKSVRRFLVKQRRMDREV